MKSEKKIGICLDAWKLPIFKKSLDDAGFEYKERKGPVPGCITLTVETAEIEKLRRAVTKANGEAAKSKMN